MGLLEVHAKGIQAAIERELRNPGPPPAPPSFNVWSFLATGTQIPRGAGLEMSGTYADVLSGFGTAAAASGGTGGGMFALPSEIERKQEEEARKRLLEGKQFDTTAGNILRRRAEELAPNPETTHRADQILYGIGKDVTKALFNVATMGPVAGSVAFGAESGNTAAQRLIEQGVDPATAAKVGGVTGVIQGATVAIPGVGPTVAKTIGLAAATGPVSFMTQEALTREILKRADYGDLAAQHDPMDPLGLGLSIILPGVVGGVHIRGLQKRAKLEDVVKHIESGGKRYDDKGNLLTSPKGAQGEMQVMPGTATDPGFGVTPAKDSSPEELARVGREYLAAMQQRYGETDKALAAYNAGPGAVDAAVKKHGADWLKHMPEETRNYVAKANRLMGEASATPEAVDAARVRLTDEALAQSLPDYSTARAELMAATDLVAAGHVDAAPLAIAPIHVTETPDFPHVFKETVNVVDENGNDIVVYRGLFRSGVQVLRIDSPSGVQATMNRGAQSADERLTWAREAGPVGPATISVAVSRPKRLLQSDKATVEFELENLKRLSPGESVSDPAVIQRAKAEGHDSIVDATGNIAVFTPPRAGRGRLRRGALEFRNLGPRTEAPIEDVPPTITIDEAADAKARQVQLRQVLEDQPNLKVKVSDETVTAEEALLRAHEEYDFDLTEAELLKAAANCALTNS